MSFMDEANDYARDELDQFVPAVFARCGDEAELYRMLLDDHGIPALVGLENRLARAGGAAGRLPGRRSISRSEPVFVPEALLDDAERIIAECPDVRKYAEQRRNPDLPEDTEEYDVPPWEMGDDDCDDGFETDFFDDDEDFDFGRSEFGF